jgi:hypothetical protein
MQPSSAITSHQAASLHNVQACHRAGLADPLSLKIYRNSLKKAGATGYLELAARAWPSEVA